MHAPVWYPHFGVFMPFFMLLMVCICLFFIFRVTSGHRSNSPTKRDEAMDVLRKRFASSEISEADFLKMSETLKGR